jgi:hypothetical protein
MRHATMGGRLFSAPSSPFKAVTLVSRSSWTRGAERDGGAVSDKLPGARNERMSDAGPAGDQSRSNAPRVAASRRLDEALFIANANWAAWGSLREAWPALSVWHLEHSLREWTRTRSESLVLARHRY